MATNDKIDIQEEDIKEEDFSPETLADDTIDWKAEALKLKGIAKRRATKLAKLKDKANEPPVPTPAPEPKPSQPKSDKLDYGQLAYLAAKGIDTPEGVALAKKVMSETGKELLDVVDSKYFQAELKEMKEAKAAKEAIPQSSPRSPAPSGDTVAYWIAKGELPPNTPENQQLRRDIVKQKTAIATGGSKFTDTPVVSNSPQAK